MRLIPKLTHFIMKTSGIKSLVIVAAVLIVTGLTTQNVFAQRGGRGGGGGRGFGGGGGHSFSGGSRSSSSSFSRSSSTTRISGGARGFYGGRGGWSGGVRFRTGLWAYHRPYYSYYHFYRPYLGISLGILPFGYYPFYFGADQFYYSGGLFYQQYDNEYKVVVPPVGAQVPKLPSEAQEVSINGQTYYEYKGVYYTTAKNDKGETVYVVAGKDGVLNTDGNSSNSNSGYNGPLIGDIVTSLPQDAKEVLLKGQKYYVTTDGVYYEEVIDGDKVTYKVVGL